MGRWDRVTERLDGGADRVLLSWAELEQLVGALPASATNHRAWWSGDRPHVQAWRCAGFTLGRLAPGEFVEFVRSGASPPHPKANDSESLRDQEVTEVAHLLRSRNAIDAQLGALTGRPMTSGHLGEWLAARILPIELESSATTAGIDGRFVEDPLSGRTVNVKWYLKREGLLDLTLPGPDLYLVLTGPRAPVASSRGQTRPWCVDAVYLFDARELLEAQRRRGVKVGVASSVPAAMWDAAEIFPRPTCALLPLDDRRRSAFNALGSRAVAPDEVDRPHDP